MSSVFTFVPVYLPVSLSVCARAKEHTFWPKNRESMFLLNEKETHFCC